MTKKVFYSVYNITFILSVCLSTFCYFQTLKHETIVTLVNYTTDRCFICMLITWYQNKTTRFFQVASINITRRFSKIHLRGKIMINNKTKCNVRKIKIFSMCQYCIHTKRIELRPFLLNLNRPEQRNNLSYFLFFRWNILLYFISSLLQMMLKNAHV